MILKITCLHCGKKVPPNPRLKNQKYCCAKECQQARMRTWKNRQYKKKSKYHKRSLASQKVWRSKYPAYKYQRDYRKTHPEYVIRNRDLQKERNKKRQKNHSTMIVNTDSLLFQPMENGVYTLSKIKKNMIVNRNALSLQPSIDGSYALLKVKGKKIVNRNTLMAEVYK
jgi:NAD-dependent SIR2 family protein deacetylase